MKKNILKRKKKSSELSGWGNEDILKKIKESVKGLSGQSKPLMEFSRKIQKILTAKKPERTLTIIKPDAVEKSLTGEIIERLEKQNIKPVAMKMRKLSKVEAGLFYFHLLGKVPDKVFASIIDYMTSSKVVFVVWQGKGVVKKVRKLCGPTDPQKAIKSQLRSLSDDDMGKEFQAGKAVKNIIHSSANSAEAAKEIDFFFRPWEF